MSALLNHQKNNIIFGLGISLAVLIFSQNLGAGEYLNNHVAFGYGGVAYFRPITAVNEPLYLPDPSREGRLYYKATNNSLIDLEVPPRSTNFVVFYKGADLPLNPSLAPTCYENNATVIGSRLYDFTAVDENDKEVNSFNRKLTVSLAIPELPQDLSDIGVYYLDTNNRWQLIPEAKFNPQNKTSFQVFNLAVLAVMKAPDLPTMIQSAGNCFQAPTPLAGQVLGVKKYADGALLRTPDFKIYVVLGNEFRYIASPAELKNYRSKIFDISFDEFNNLKKSINEEIITQGDVIVGGGDPILRETGQVLGVKTQYFANTRIYADGALLRTPDNKVYLVANPEVKFIANLSKDIYQWAGNRIYDISFDDLALYRDQRIIENEEVNNVPKFSNGNLLRTRDWKVYEIQNGKAVHIATLPVANQDYYQGKKVYDIDYGVLAQYTGLAVPASPKEVLGVKQYADNSLLRTPDFKVYVLTGGKLNLIATLRELQNYAGRNIINISFDELNRLMPKPLPTTQETIGGPQKVLGIKQYADGTLLRTPSWKLYEVVNQKVQLLANYQVLSDTYLGKKIFDVDFSVIAEYELLK